MDTGKTLCVYITIDHRDNARKLAQTIVQGRFAACVNILGPIESIYRWEGRIENTEEIVLLVKTTADRYAALEGRVRELHPYDTPCIVAWPHSHGDEKFLAWVRGEVRPELAA